MALQTTRINYYGDIKVKKEEGNVRRKKGWQYLTYITATSKILKDNVEFSLANYEGELGISLSFKEGVNNEIMYQELNITEEDFGDIIQNALTALIKFRKTEMERQ